jgi:hypothetical protein
MHTGPIGFVYERNARHAFLGLAAFEATLVEQ